MSNSFIWQSFIVPMCRRNSKSTNVDVFYGTVFFVGSSGVFVTAKHVYEDMLAAKEKNKDHAYGLCVKDESNVNMLAFIEKIEFESTGLDIAIGKVNLKVDSPIKLSRSSLNFFQDVFTCGYPSAATEIGSYPDPRLHLDLRGYKGYINREVSTKAMEIAGLKVSAELSFRIEKGMSGSPLFISNDLLSGGVCLEARTSEQFERRIGESEPVLRHTEYGIACMTSSFDKWKPSFLSELDQAALFF